MSVQWSPHRSEAWWHAWRRLVRACLIVATVLSWAVLCSPQLAAGAGEVTSIVGEFRGCEIGRAYALANGRLLVCRSYFYHVAHAPKVRIINDQQASIDGDLYEVVIEEAPVVRQPNSDAVAGCSSGDEQQSSTELSPDKCAVFHHNRADAKRYWPEAYQEFEDAR